jgi:hypothetical protein
LPIIIVNGAAQMNIERFYLRIFWHIAIIPIQGVDALVTVAFHQCFYFTALGFRKVVLHSQRAYLVFVEWETL